MLNDPILLNDWHVVAYAPDLQEGRPMAVRLEMPASRLYHWDLQLRQAYTGSQHFF